MNALTENKPPPIRMIRISDFGLPDPKRDPDRHQNCITWSLSHALPSTKFRQNPFTSLRVIRRTDRQTDRQTDKQTNRPHRKHNLLLSAEVIKLVKPLTTGNTRYARVCGLTITKDARIAKSIKARTSVCRRVKSSH